MPRLDDYGRLAPWYDLTAARVLASVHRRIAERCAVRGFSAVLDVGCGTGGLLAVLREKGIRAAGLDASPAMLARAVRNVRRRQTPCLVRGGIPLPFATHSFDAAVLSLVLHETDEEPEDLLRECLRVAPVGVVLEWRMPERNLEYPLQPLVHAIERLAGKRHYARFRHFARGGYLHGAAMRAGARIVWEEALAGGTMVLAEVVFPSSGL